MQQLYYVSHEGKEHGPWSLDHIVSLLTKSELTMSDYLYDESKADWVLFLEHGPLSELMGNKKPKAPPRPAPKQSMYEEDSTPFGEKTVVAQAKALPETHKTEEWFVLKWDNRYGPFTFLDLVKMLQDKSVFEFDYVWKPGFQSWKRIAEVDNFHADQIRHLKSAELPELSEVFFRRRHVRSKYNGSIIVHDNKSVWKGESLEVSEGGAGIVMHNALVLPGQQIHLHFKPGDGVPPFNAVCEVISKQYVKGVKQKDTAIGYGIKFLEINKEAQTAIRDYSREAA